MKLKSLIQRLFISCLSGALTLALVTNATAEVVDVTVTVRNLAPTNSVSFAALRLGFGNGSFDSFNNNQLASNPIISVAELGSGNAWFPAFAGADPSAVLGSILGPLTPGATASNTFRVDSMSAANRFFTFATMVVPSNDLFLGNDNPMQYQLFDSSGNLLINTITQSAGQIWDAGSEAPVVANAAFIPGSVTAGRTDQNGVVTFDRSELSIFNGLTTNAGYTFSDSLLSNSTPIYEISFSATAVPEPSSAVFAMLGLAAFRVYRRKRTQVKSSGTI